MAKTKEEILGMSKKDLRKYMWSKDLDVKEVNSNCSNCSYCSYCRNAKNLRYAICNIEVGKEAYEAKIEELR